MDGIVHGGFLATLLDNAFAYLGLASSSLTPAATAYIKLYYLKPVKYF
jgi:thioesterase superfamily protein 4